MEEMKRSAAQMEKPVKTEWSPQCVIFTYFQGDISSVVDEHFSRALSNIKKPQELSPLSQSEDVVLSNDGYLQIGDGLDMPPNEWCFSSEWTKPQPEVSFANGVANCNMNGFQPMAMTQHPQPPTGSPSVEPGQMLHFSSSASTSSPEPEYPCEFSSGHLVSQAQLDGEYESLLNFPHQEKCVAHPQQSAMWQNCDSGQATRSMGSPFNQPFNSAHCEKYFPPAHGPASVSLSSDSLAHEGDLACNPGMRPNWGPNQQPFGSQPVLNPPSYTSQGERDFLEEASLQREEGICSFIELQFEEENFWS